MYMPKRATYSDGWGWLLAMPPRKAASFVLFVLFARCGSVVVRLCCMPCVLASLFVSVPCVSLRGAIALSAMTAWATPPA